MSNDHDIFSRIDKQQNGCYTVEEPCNLLTQLQALQAEHADNTAQMEAEIKAIQLKYQPELNRLTNEIKAYFEQLKDWIAKYREYLPPNSGKTIRFSTGTVLWRQAKETLSIPDETSLIATLKTLKLNAYVKVKTTIDKAALAKLNPTMLDKLGISKQRGSDTFHCEPNQGKKLSDTMFKEKDDGEKN